MVKILSGIFLSSLCHYLSWRDSDNIYLIYIPLLFETIYGIYIALFPLIFSPSHRLMRKIGLRDNYRSKISQWTSVAGSGLKHFNQYTTLAMRLHLVVLHFLLKIVTMNSHAEPSQQMCFLPQDSFLPAGFSSLINSSNIILTRPTWGKVSSAGDQQQVVKN